MLNLQTDERFLNVIQLGYASAARKDGVQDELDSSHGKLRKNTIKPNRYACPNVSLDGGEGSVVWMSR